MMPHMSRLRRQMVEALRVHLTSGVRPRVPDAGVPIWQAFAALSEGRTCGALGPDPIQYAEIAAWDRLMGVALRPDHVAIIAAMDGAWLEWARKPEAEREAPAGPLTGAVWDAMFG